MSERSTCSHFPGQTACDWCRNPSRDYVSVLVEGYYSEDIAAKVGMYQIRRLPDVLDARLEKVWRPDPFRPTFWRVEASFAASRHRATVYVR